MIGRLILRSLENGELILWILRIDGLVLVEPRIVTVAVFLSLHIPVLVFITAAFSTATTSAAAAATAAAIATDAATATATAGLPVDRPHRPGQRGARPALGLPPGAYLHSSTSQLNVSTFCG